MDTRVKTEYDKNVDGVQCGRSMIEMLGVLAIIGVLSVGGIAGYSKAMEMHQLNKWLTSLVQMINDIQIAFSNQKYYSNTEEDITDTLVSANIISSDTIDNNHKDIFGNKLKAFTINWKDYGLRFEIKYEMIAGKNAVNCCKKLYELVNYYNNIWAIGDWSSYTICGKSAPLQYKKDMNCQAYSLNKIMQKCNTCNTQNCNIGVLFSNNPY